MPSIRDALRAATSQLAPASDSASLDAQVLLCEVLGVERSYLLGHPEQVLTPDQHERYQALVARGAAGEPLAYILGRRAFYDREFIVSSAVLIPRPETELLLEQALDYVKQQPQAVVVDVGTGSGALAITLAARCPPARVYATDISPAALDIAQQNAIQQHTPITFFEGDLAQPLIERNIQVDLVLANLPYIAHADLQQLAVRRYEPHLALDGGADGLDLIRRLLRQIPLVCKPGALVLLEIGAGQGAAVLKLVRESLAPHAATVLLDYAGHERIVRVELQ